MSSKSTISGFTVLKNAIRFDYPFREAIRSALPMCDEFIAVVGESDDGTLEAVREIDDAKIRIIETTWSDKVKPSMCVLAQQTNIGLHLCSGDWALYVQANEVLHEDSLPKLKDLMDRNRDDANVEAILLQRLTFWGDYAHAFTAYPHRFKFSPRILRPYIGTYSIRDAMSFAVFDNFSTRGRYPRAIDSGQDIYRYGHVLTPELMEDKIRHIAHLGRPEDDFDANSFYQSVPKSFVEEFHGMHPTVMKQRIDSFKQTISMDDPNWRTVPSLKERQRLLETWWYKKFGIPRARNTRYKLLGNYAKTPATPNA
jgi:glycosyltransferase involved in cell wall biosynthesis